MQMTEILLLNCNGSYLAGYSIAGPVRFTCDGDPNTLMVHHSIWEPRKLLKVQIPFDCKVVIEKRG